MKRSELVATLERVTAADVEAVLRAWLHGDASREEQILLGRVLYPLSHTLLGLPLPSPEDAADSAALQPAAPAAQEG